MGRGPDSSKGSKISPKKVKIQEYFAWGGLFARKITINYIIFLGKIDQNQYKYTDKFFVSTFLPFLTIYDYMDGT